MSRNRWHILREEGTLTLARRLPVRFDLQVRTVLPVARKLRLAHQVRQDMWRALRDQRGFAPVVRVAEENGVLVVTAGGQVDGAFARAEAEARIAHVLYNPENRRRWIRWAA